MNGLLHVLDSLCMERRQDGNVFDAIVLVLKQIYKTDVQEDKVQLTSAVVSAVQELSKSCHDQDGPEPHVMEQFLQDVEGLVAQAGTGGFTSDQVLSLSKSMLDLIQCCLVRPILRTSDDEGSEDEPSVAEVVLRCCSQLPSLPLTSHHTLQLLSWAYNSILKEQVLTGDNMPGWQVAATLSILSCAVHMIAGHEKLQVDTTSVGATGGVVEGYLKWCHNVITSAMAAVTPGSATSKTVGGGLVQGACELGLASAYAALSIHKAWSGQGQGPDAGVSVELVQDVVEHVSCMAEACLAAAATVMDKDTAVNKLLAAASGMLKRLEHALPAVVAAGLPYSSILAQFKSMACTASLLALKQTSRSHMSWADAGVAFNTQIAAAAAVPDDVTTLISLISHDNQAWWAYDLSTGSTGAYVATSSQAVASSTSATALFVRHMCESLSQGLAAAWSVGNRQLVVAMLLPPEPAGASPHEAQVAAALLARVYAIIQDGRQQLSAATIPLLFDHLGAYMPSMATKASTAAPPATSVQERVSQQTAACIMLCISTVAAISAVTSDKCNAHPKDLVSICECITAGYKQACMASTGGSRPSSPGAVIDLVPYKQHIAVCQTYLTMKICSIPGAAKPAGTLQHQLLSLFISLASTSSHAQAEQAALLIPAIAHVSQAATRNASIRSLTRFSHADLAQLAEHDLKLVKLLRKFWLLLALHGLSAQPCWQTYLADVAAASPLLLVGLGGTCDDDSLQKLKSEMGETMTAAGSSADPARLRSLLHTSLDLSPGSLPANLQLPMEPVVQAYLVSVAVCERHRARACRLNGRRSTCPLAMTLGYLEVTRSAASLSPWYTRVAEVAFNKHLSYLDAQVQEGVANEDSVSVSVEDLAVTLVLHLSNPAGGHEEGKAAQVVEVSTALLQSLLTRSRGLYWSKPCWQALLSMVHWESVDQPLGSHLQNPTSTAGASSRLWKVVTGWIATAAASAPGITEALLHEFLSQQPASCDAVFSNTVTTTRQQLSGPGSSFYAASTAAMRYASVLLSAASRERGSASVVKVDATLAVCLKQYYLGIVQGATSQLQNVGLDDVPYVAPNPQQPSAKLTELVETVVQCSRTRPGLKDGYLCAAALLVSSCTGGDASSVAAAGSEQQPLAVPTNDQVELLDVLFQSDMSAVTSSLFSSAIFSWTWVIAAAPHVWLLPVAQRCLGAWTRAAQLGLGLFTGVPNRTMTVSLQEGLQCHDAWISLLDEIWEVAADGIGQASAQVVKLLVAVLDASLTHLDHLSWCAEAAGPLSRLLLLALKVSQRCVSGGGVPAHQAAVLRDKVLRAGLEWFAQPVQYSGSLSQHQSQAQVSATRHLATHVGTLAARTTQEAWNLSNPEQSGPHPVWKGAGSMGDAAAKLLSFLLSREVDRLQVWNTPAPGVAAPATSTTAAAALPALDTIPAKEWEAYLEAAWKVAPRLAVCLADRFSAVSIVQKLVGNHVVADRNLPEVQSMPEAALLMISTCSQKGLKPSAPEWQALSTWAAGQASQGLQLISGAAGANAHVRAYAVRCLDNTDPEQVTFYLPQLIQCLRHDQDGAITAALSAIAARSDLFAHQLAWALQTEEQPPEEAFNPEVKRSGWQPPKDYGLWKPAGELRLKLLSSLHDDALEYWKAEDGYFNMVTSISGILKKVDKDERRGVIAAKLSEFSPSRGDLYIPTNPHSKVLAHIPSSGTPMQSAAKVPILVAFQVQDCEDPVPVHRKAIANGTPSSSRDQQEDGNHDAVGGAVSDGRANEDMGPGGSGSIRTLACIFKVGDDVRQDVLALQVIHILRDAFKSAGLPAYLCPYGCLPTGYERGVIEVVPNTKSRAALGEMSDKGLFDIFQSQFGPPGSPAFEAARQNFIASEAGYAIASFLLQSKDRHNGNLLISGDGHLVHIDFGFILEISPGGNLGFESAAFKLSHEMAQLLDPGGTRTSSTWQQFQDLCVRAYLVSRTVAEPIIATVALMAESGLPCFGRGAPVANLRRRFHLEMNERQAAAFMRNTINDAYQKWTTGFYDYIQALQNSIPY